MTRDEILQEVLQINNTNILLECSTGTGKSKLALDKLNQWFQNYTPTLFNSNKILIVIPRLVLIQNWKDEFIKWGYEKYLPQVEFITYVSLPKLVGTSWFSVLYDEGHHISERCQQAIPYIKSNYNILLSATIKRTLKPILFKLFPNLYIYKISLVDAIENEILPEPRIVLIPLQLETTRPDEIYEVNPKKRHQKAVTYSQWLKGKWQYLKGNFDYGVKIRCTQRQKYQEICDFIDNCTRKLQNNLVAGMNRVMVEQARKRKGLERLQWLAEIKSDFVKQLLGQLKNYRTLTFCYNTKQADNLCKNSIHSKNKKSAQILEAFNNKKIKHISAIDCLTEGVNLSECKVLVFAKLDASLIKQVQKLGKLNLPLCF